MRSKDIASLVGLGLLVSAVMPGPLLAQMVATHELAVTLIPERAQLVGRDRIRIQGPPGGRLELFLSPNARVHSIHLNGRDHPFSVERGRVFLSLDRNASRDIMDLDLAYACRFDDPAPVQPLNTDNPGYGVSGTISPRGTFILSGAAWYPRVIGARETFDLRVNAPAGIIAVTTGRRLGIINDKDRTVSRWRIDNPLEGVSLSAGPYVVEQKTGEGLTAATYLFAENQALASRYLEMSLSYLKDYSDRFGAYPFEAFAVVENFFPTGYGFPGYCLMGGTILRLPFIPYTSLPHEIVHNWWGNGVLVAPTSGNWCEGLATYAADYLIKERQSPEAAMDYRRQTMRNYAALVSESSDFPLSLFRSRVDPATKVIGYDKAAMVFHMLREKMGDTLFWGALRDLFGQYLFKHASWGDLQKGFEDRWGRSLDTFFDQWVYRPGAPRLRLEEVRRSGNDRLGYRVTGRLVQEKPYFTATLRLVVETAKDATGQSVQLSGRQTDFAIETVGKPKTLLADPEYHLFRKMAAEEIPATINALKGSTALRLVIAKRLGREGGSIASRLTRAMGVESFTTIDEADLGPTGRRSTGDLLFIGLPEGALTERWFPSGLKLAPDSFSLSGQRFGQPADVLFCVARHPRQAEKIVALLHPLTAKAADAVIHKLAHYGRYSFLAFGNGQIRLKGTWEVKASPMIVKFDPENGFQGAAP